ncbi:hypothetical protein Pla52n_51020 [Stieleria varia]|uniref:Uncharacterized protein n=1 Tax=Stieleria varia TaxID=2528005 RepID=A0A5C6AGQ7_9BACT|nr:hypothetical protein Pla52n_51020 [Stieleria varia]
MKRFTKKCARVLFYRAATDTLLARKAGRRGQSMKTKLLDRELEVDSNSVFSDSNAREPECGTFLVPTGERSQIGRRTTGNAASNGIIIDSDTHADGRREVGSHV